MSDSSKRPEERIEERLRANTSRLVAAQRIARIGDFIWDLKTDELTWSDSLFELVQYRPSEGIDTRTFNREIIYPTDRDRVARWLREAAASDRKRAEAKEYRLIRKDGEIIYVRTEAMVERAHGSTRIFGTVQDITERKRAELALQESEERFRLAFDQQFQFMAILSPEGRVLEVNRLPESGPGFVARDFVGKLLWHGPAWRDLPEWQKILESRIEQAKAQRGPLLTEDAWQTASGNVRFAAAAYTAVRNDDGGIRFVLVQATDVTARKRAEEELRERGRQLKALSLRLQSVQEELSARIARELHDELGQALTALRFDLSWTADRIADDSGDSTRREAIARIESMKTFIDDTIASVRRIATELRPRVLDDSGLVAALEWQAREFEHRTEIVCEFAAEGDELEPNGQLATAIFRIFQELLTNVARHAEASLVSAVLRREGDALQLVVTDDGNGLAEGGSPGSLGIVGMRERAEGLGGEIDVDGRPGQGTSITVRIPFNTADGET